MKRMLNSRTIRVGVVCQVLTWVVPLTACTAWAGGYQALVIQGAGYLPGSRKPEGADAITHATTLAINTYSLTQILGTHLQAHAIAVHAVPWSACNAGVFSGRTVQGKTLPWDVVIFAGPSHFSKQPKPLMALYPRLKEAIARNPRVVATTLVPAWFPESKGVAAIKAADEVFAKMGVTRVAGATVLTPREKTCGASSEEVEKALSTFAARIADAVKKAHE